jgi:zinc protease
MTVYRVGSRNEAVGYTGSTHFLEHMMFKGTDRFPNFDGVLTPLGADYNATTSYDRTNYFAKVPTEHVGTVIALEADRMRNLNLRQDHRNSEMTVVRNEFENGKNSPFSVLIEQLGATAFDAHPYHHPIIGWLSDVENVPLARLKAFYDEFYWPNNATVMVTGNYGTDADVLKTITDEFGAIPAVAARHP